eukprot:TRINITY_DN2552_c0_g2_i6.p1 TRINITY_DN2552_c0_g2~~TRINITY_DN2552_c0_g2_i6.p1  ORF type:complete len:384 (-),score=33.56 TRINITY_DN2552_c0_g2_i6:42-1193(-)
MLGRDAKSLFRSPLYSKLFHSHLDELEHNPALDLDKDKTEKQSAKHETYLYDKGNNLIVYHISSIATSYLSYENTKNGNLRSIEPIIEKIRNVKNREEGVWEKRKARLVISLTEGERHELETALNKQPYKLFPMYSCSSSLTVPEGCVTFNSRFECGNLQEVVLVGENQYNLVLRSDTSTTNYAQWFYFCVQNTKKDTTVKFNIINLRKNLASYSDGMIPSVYSKEKERNENIAWHNAGNDVTYKKGTNYTLSFSYTFEYSCDSLYFSHTVPYSYSQLKQMLKKLKTNCLYEPILSIRNLCYTFALNKCPYIIITEDCQNYATNKRPAVIVTARVHPGESNSSYVLEGFLHFLLSNDQRAAKLRSTFTSVSYTHLTLPTSDLV